MHVNNCYGYLGIFIGKRPSQKDPRPSYSDIVASYHSMCDIVFTLIQLNYIPR